MAARISRRNPEGGQRNEERNIDCTAKMGMSILAIQSDPKITMWIWSRVELVHAAEAAACRISNPNVNIVLQIGRNSMSKLDGRCQSHECHEWSYLQKTWTLGAFISFPLAVYVCVHCQKEKQVKRPSRFERHNRIAVNGSAIPEFAHQKSGGG